MDQEKIGKFIAASRKRKNLTQEEFAQKINVTNKAVSRWETGRGIPDCSYFSSICKTLDITVEELLSGEKATKNNDIMVEYLSYKEKQKKKNILCIILINIMVLVIGIFILFFINNYKNINIYRLNGESDNFIYQDGLFVNSNIKNIFKSGIINIKNSNIKEDDMISITFVQKDGEQYYQIYSTTDDSDSFIVEDYGYDEIFSSDNKSNATNLCMVISYKLADVLYKEIIELNAEKILTNNRFYYNKAKSVSSQKSKKAIDIKEENNLQNFKDILIEDGFVEGCYELVTNCDNYLQKEIGKNEYLVVNYISKQLYYFYRNGDESIKANYVLDSNQSTMIISIKKNDTYGTVIYDFENDKFKYNCSDSQKEKADEVVEIVKNYQQIINYKLK